MILRPIIILILHFLLILPIAQGQTFQWASSPHSLSAVYPNETIFDSQGNVYITGHCFKNTSFGSFKTESDAFFLVKYDITGNVLWAKFGKGTYGGAGASLAFDMQGNIYVAGNFQGQLNLGEAILEGTNQAQGFLLKYTASGDLLWAKVLGNNSPGSRNEAQYVAVDQENNVYVAGDFYEYIILEGGIRLDVDPPSHLNSDVYLVKYNKDGKIYWGKSAGTDEDDRARGLKVGPDNKILLGIAKLEQTGSNEFNFDDTPFQISTFNSVVITCSTDGGADNFKSIKGMVTDFDLDELGNLYATGFFNSEIDFDGNFPLTTESSSGNFVVKYSNEKTVQWSKKIEFEETYHTYIAASKDHIYVGGMFSGQISTERYVLSAIADRDVFILNFNGQGCEQWLKRIEGTYRDMFTSIAVSRHKTLAITGYYTGTSLNFDNITVNNSVNNWYNGYTALLKDASVPSGNPFLLVDKDIICGEEKAILTAEVISDEPIQWYKNGQPFYKSLNTSLEINEAGEYYFMISQYTRCEATSNSIVIRKSNAPEKAISAEPGLQTCNNSPVRLETKNHSDYQYQWYRDGQLLPGKTDHFITATENGKYYAILNNNGDCSVYSDSVSIQILPSENDFLPDTIYRCPNIPVILSPENLKFKQWNYSWSTNETTSSIEINEDGLYKLTISEGECAYTDQVLVKNYEKPIIPNIITPNGDQLNDFFVINNLTHKVHLSIFNRWGKLIYDDKEYFNNWSAEGQENGIYHYIIRDNTGCWKKNISKGWLQVLR